MGLAIKKYNMKVMKFITHPYLMIFVFCCILVSGEHWGGFYLVYLLLALPHGGIHSIFAVLGVGMLLFSFHKYMRTKTFLIESVLNILGNLLLVFSLVLFFHNDREGYNAGTFEQAVPIITLILFSLISICFLVDNIIGLSKKSDRNMWLKKG